MSEELIEELALAIGGPEDDGMDGHYWELDLASARAILPIIRRRELEAGEKVKAAAVDAVSEGEVWSDTPFSNAVRDLDVAAIIGDSYD